jgi:hypothetical protein
VTEGRYIRQNRPAVTVSASASTTA